MVSGSPDRDRVFPRLVALLLVLITAVPYLAGLSVDDPETRFDGVMVFPEDTNAYLAFARQASEGRLALKNPFTPEPHEGGLMGIGWWLMGWVAAIPGSTVEAGFHFVRLLGIALLVLAVHRWCERLFASVFLRRVVLVAVTTGGGFGWLLTFPWVAERMGDFLALDTFAGLHPFFWMLLAPHFLLAQALFLFTLLAWTKAETGESGLLPATLLAAAVAATRPFDALVLVATIVLVQLARAVTGRPSRSRLIALGPLFGAGVVLAYDVWLFSAHPVFKWWGEQNVVLPPQPGSLAVSLGFVLPLLVLAVAGMLVRGMGSPLAGGGPDTTTSADAPDPARLVIGGACVAALGVVYAYPPLLFTFQALPAVAIPATFVGALVIEAPLSRWRARMPVLVSLLVLVLVAAHASTSYLLLEGRTRMAAAGSWRTDRDLLYAFSWFEGEADPDDVVLAAPETCNLLPRYAPVTAFTGYRYATVEAATKDRLARLFFLPQVGESFRRDLIREHGIDFVLVSRAERRAGGWKASASPMLRERFSNAAATIYEVVSD